MKPQTIIRALRLSAQRAGEWDRLADTYSWLYPQYVHEFLEARERADHYRRLCDRIGERLARRLGG
jgi:hypothetical protein